MAASPVVVLSAGVEGPVRPREQPAGQSRQVLAERSRFLRTAAHVRGGREIGAGGEAVAFAFCSAREAVSAAVAAQRVILTHSWPSGGFPAVRMGLDADVRPFGRSGRVGPVERTAASISLSAHDGQILVSESARRRLGDNLPPGVTVRDLGVHRLRDLQHTMRLFQVVHPDLPDDFPPPKTLNVLPNNLPLQLTSFVGRGGEIAEIVEAFTGTRLLTLSGAGGCGKTRLALQLAAELAEDFKDGVWLVDLAAVSDPALVSRALASVVGVREQPGRPVLDALAAYLGSRALLVLLDNCEHVVSACAELADGLLRRCPDLRIVATSRERLQVEGEVSYRVPSLSLPPAGTVPSPDSYAQSEAVRLFVERAALHRPGFRLSSSNVAKVVEACHQLDGIPLAIELAAARVGVLSIGEIVRRLNDRFRFLTSAYRTALPRHRTLRAAIDWSYLLLSDTERVLFRRLSVFSGGCTLDAAEAVCAEKGTEGAEVLHLLGQLVDKSLVIAEERGDETRYRLLETVRQYAAERLREAGEDPAMRRRHRDWCLLLAERAEAGVNGPDQVAWLERLEAEHDNLRAALKWSRTQASGSGAGLRLASAVWWFWFMRGHWSEGRMRLEDALSRCASTDVSPEALLGTAYLAWRQGDYQRARVLCDDALARCEARDDRRGVAISLLNLGNVAAQEDAYDRSWELSGKSLALGRQLDDKIVMGWALAQRGAVARIKGDYERAAAFYAESLAQVKAAGNPYWTAFVLRGLGALAIKRGDPRGASAYYLESLTLSKALGDRWIAEGCLSGLAAVACAGGQHRRAARLFGAVEALREALGHRWAPADQADYDRLVASIRTRLGDAVFAAAWEAGRAKTLAQVIDEALALERDAASRSRAGQRSSVRPAKPLTRREQEVATLIARGLSNREISSVLLIKRRTAETHVQHILDKLGVKSRTQTVAWAISRGLLEPPRTRPSPSPPALGATSTSPPGARVRPG